MKKMLNVIVSDTLPPTSDAYHVSTGGNLYLINYGVGKSDLLPQHRKHIDNLVVPFLVRAIKRLGPGEYELHVYGSASATGNWDDNMSLAGSRAFKAASYAIAQFEAKQKTDPSLSRARVDPNIVAVGATISKNDPLIRKARTKDQVEKIQPHFRSSLFIFKAGIVHPKGASTFHIREHYFFKFKKIEEPVPEFLKRVMTLLDKNPLVKQILTDGFNKGLKQFFDAIGPFLTMLTKHTVGFLIPDTADYCYEVKDYRQTHALYRYNGKEHKDSFSLMEILGLLAGLFSAFKTISDIVGKEQKVEKWLDIAVKELDKEAGKLTDTLRPLIGEEAANGIKAFLQLAKDGKLKTAMFAPASGWEPFQFHDGGPDHNVVELEGHARRLSVEASLVSSVELSFGGFVPNSWTDYNATALVVTFSGRNSVIGAHSDSQGMLIRLKGPYPDDLVSGPFDPVTDAQ